MLSNDFYLTIGPTTLPPGVTTTLVRTLFRDLGDKTRRYQHRRHV